MTAEVVEQRKDKKIVAFKYKRRKGYHRTVGHRRKLTRIKIKTIDLESKKAGSKKSEIDRTPTLKHQTFRHGS